jgi:hypothetical protein
MKALIEIFDEYLDNFLKTKELSQINFEKILKQLKVDLPSIEVFVNDSYFFNIEAEIFNIKNNSDMEDIKEAYSGFTKPQLKKYLHILEYFVQEVHHHRAALVNNPSNYCEQTLLSGNVFKSLLPSEIKNCKELFIYDTNKKDLYTFFGKSINIFNLEVVGYTAGNKYKLNIPYFTVNNILTGNGTYSDFPSTTNVENFKLNKNMIILTSK